jgi:signal transduction histidine kinase
VPAQHAWNRSPAGWNTAFRLCLLLAAARLLTAAELTTSRRVAGLAVIGALALAYELIPLRSEPPLGRANFGYLALLIVGIGIACAADPTLGLLLFIGYPQMWNLSGRTRNGVICTGLLTLSSGIGFLTAAGWTAAQARVIAPTLAVSLGFSVLMGVWISRIIDQSRERAELIAQLEATRAELGEAHHAQGVTAERERMAREIHDTLAQGFTSIIMLAQAARAEREAGSSASSIKGQAGTPASSIEPVGDHDRLAAIEDVARENLHEARALVTAFSPPGLDNSTLTDAVRRLAQRFGAETGVAVDVQVGELAGLTRESEAVLLRATQEALANVRRHARARLVTIALTDDGVSATVQVDDDGVGFSPEQASSRSESGGGFGLAGMRGRVRDAGGEVQVVSAPGAGTRVTVRVPLPAGS